MKKKDIEIKLSNLEIKLNDKSLGTKNKKQSISVVIITEFSAGIASGVVVGYFADKVFQIFPTFTVIFIILGFFSSFMNIYKTFYSKK